MRMIDGAIVSAIRDERCTIFCLPRVSENQKRIIEKRGMNRGIGKAILLREREDLLELRRERKDFSFRER